MNGLLRRIKKRFKSFKRDKVNVAKEFRHLKAGDIAIDCGANVGKITCQLAETGARVYAFEPNPYAFARLKEATKKYPNVLCFQQAVGAGPGIVKLYLHENAHQDQEYWSTGSSLLAHKSNVNADTYVEVECIDLCQFITELNQPVQLLKMDVEGVECPILKRMIDTDLILRIGQVYCEMHDKRVPELREASDEIRRLVQERNLTHVDLNWI